MKLKPLHIILIVLIVIECVALGLYLRPQPQLTAITAVSLNATYSTNESGAHQLLSSSQGQSCPSFSFGSNESKQLTFNGTPVDFMTYYQQKDAFQKQYHEATDEDWASFRDTAVKYATKALTMHNQTLEYARSVATWSSVNAELLDENAGKYTIVFTTETSEWSDAFKSCLSDKTAPQKELALGACVRIENTDYPAVVYMSVDGNVVHYHVMFGTEFIRDFSNKDAKISIFSPDGNDVLARTTIRTTYSADMMESRYRSIIDTVR